MKILLDANISYRLVNRLIDIYPECIHVSITDLIAPARDAEIVPNHPSIDEGIGVISFYPQI